MKNTRVVIVNEVKQSLVETCNHSKPRERKNA